MIYKFIKKNVHEKNSFNQFISINYSFLAHTYFCDGYFFRTQHNEENFF